MPIAVHMGEDRCVLTRLRLNLQDGELDVYSERCVSYTNGVCVSVVWKLL